MSALLGVLEGLADKDCYDRKCEAYVPRALALSDYVQAYGVSEAELKCMITGISNTVIMESAVSSRQSQNPVNVLRLVPSTANVKTRESLRYMNADMDSLCNTLLLCRGIRQAFNEKLVSFVPTDNPFSSSRYKLHVWMEATMAEPIYEGASQSIGDFDGLPLDLTVGAAQHNPFRRALSYQTLRAFSTWGRELGVRVLPVDNATSEYVRSYRHKRAVYAQQLAKDIVADKEGEEEG